MHRLWDISSNISLMPTLDLSDIANDLLSDSTPFIFMTGLVSHKKKLKDAINVYPTFPTLTMTKT